MTPITYDGTDFPGRFPVPREYEAAVEYLRGMVDGFHRAASR